MRITRQEVADVLKAAVAGEIPVRLVNPEQTWHVVYAGNMDFMLGDWRITIFNDCDELDYIDSVKAPDGREAEFEDLNGEDPVTSAYGDPLGLLSDDEWRMFEIILEQAT